MAIEELDLRDAANQLGVHYQTAYKWVRSGELEASMVDGQYRLRPDQVAAYRQSREQPISPQHPRESRRDHSRLAERLFTLLTTGEETKARKLVAELAAQDGLTHTSQALLVPVLHRIGSDWQEQRLSISVEHRASAIVERILGDLHPTPRGRRRGTAVVASLSGERHSLATTMAANALREDNWHVEHLGADIPGEEILKFCQENGTDLAILSVILPSSKANTEALATQLRAVGVRTLTGTPGASLQALQEFARDTSTGLEPPT